MEATEQNSRILQLNETLKAENSDHKAEIARLTRDAAEQRAIIQQLLSPIARDVEVARLTEERDALARQLAASDSAFDAKDRVLKHVTADYIHTQLAFSDCQRELAESKRAAADAVRRLGEWAATTGRPIQELDAAAEVARLTKERDTLASQLCEAHGKLGEITSGYRDAHRELADCHRKHADAMRRISEFERDRQTQRLEASIIQDLEAAAVGRDAELTRTKEELARTKTQLSDANDMLLLKNDHLERNKVRFGELRQEICSLQPGQVAKRIADIEKALSESQKLVATLQASEVVKRLAESEQNLADCRDLIETFRADDVVKRLDESSKKLADIQKSLSGSPNDVHRRVVEQTLTLRANELRIETLTAEVKRLSKYEAQARALQADAVAKRLAECEELVRSLRADNSSLSERLAIKWPGTALLPPTRAEYTALLEEKAQVKGFHIRDVCGLADEAFILQMGQALMDLKLQNDKLEWQVGADRDLMLAKGVTNAEIKHFFSGGTVDSGPARKRRSDSAEFMKPVRKRGGGH